MTNKQQKNKAKLIIDELKDVFDLATGSFNEFYEKADNSSSGYRSTAVSSGDYSKAASSGDRSKAASSGNCSKAASSGRGSKAASSGEYSNAAASGKGSNAASSGYESKATSSGFDSKTASSGDRSTAASSGKYSKAASSGEYSKATSSGDKSICAAIGYRAAVKGDLGNLIMASECIFKNGEYTPIGGKADIVDGKKLKANCWYIVENGNWVEVDFTDNLFSYVISTKNNIKKVKTESGEVLFVVSDDQGNSAHGKTIKEAQEDLIYKVNVDLNGEVPESATGAEWVSIYRAITGACSAGIKEFVKEIDKDINDIYTVKDIKNLVKGRFGEDEFLNAINKNKGN
jgi:hypothetical protein